MKVFQHLAQGVIAERPIFCNNSRRKEVNIDDAAIVKIDICQKWGGRSLLTVNDAQERMTKGGLYEYYQT